MAGAVVRVVGAPCTRPCTLHLHQFSVTSGPFSVTYATLNGPDVTLRCRGRVQSAGCRGRVWGARVGCRGAGAGCIVYYKL